MHVAGDGEQVDLDAVEQPRRGVGDRRQDVEMRIADMQDAIAVERGRQAGHFQLEPRQLEIERIANAAPVPRRELKPAAQHLQQESERAVVPARPQAVGAAPVAAGQDCLPPASAHCSSRIMFIQRLM